MISLPVFITLLSGTMLLMVSMLLFQLQKTKNMKKEEHERSTMVALISHRLRGPLSAIKWDTELLLNQELGKLQISQMELLNKMSDSVADAIGVLNTFLEASRIERGKMETTPLALDLMEYLPRIIQTYKPLLDEKKQVLVLPKPTQRILVYMNPLILHTIVEVVVHNAILYTPVGGKITLSIDENNPESKHVMLSITDYGIGMSPDDLQKLFTKFFRSHDALMISTTGNGLGLYLVKQMLQSIGGTITCTSQVKKGTTFTIGLPRA